MGFTSLIEGENWFARRFLKITMGVNVPITFRNRRTLPDFKVKIVKLEKPLLKA